MSWLTALIGAPVDMTPPSADRHPELDQILDWPAPRTPICTLCGIAGHGPAACVTWPCDRPAATVDATGCVVCSFPADHHDETAVA